MITILGKQDASAYWELRLQALQLHPEAFGTSYEQAIQTENPIKQSEDRLTSDHSITFGAFVNEKLIGIITILFTTADKMKHKAELVGMYVEKEYRHQGIGKQLILKAIQTARRKGSIEQINLTVVSSNVSAVHLYKSIGFEVYGVEKSALKFNGKYFDEDLMVIFL
ncbi:GNAT family N-acetyltransferase [Salirhabdus euzebyi]|uniref:GNAT family N-acetyltransferase n=1 Tax=Salirhabdus euzebyi TaxID=394506 RepID=UPI00157BB3AF|nr:GNAT family N-acetyltransferase [Salirhabdus euzebyi]